MLYKQHWHTKCNSKETTINMHHGQRTVFKTLQGTLFFGVCVTHGNAGKDRWVRTGIFLCADPVTSRWSVHWDIEIHFSVNIVMQLAQCVCRYQLNIQRKMSRRVCFWPACESSRLVWRFGLIPNCYFPADCCVWFTVFKPHSANFAEDHCTGNMTIDDVIIVL